MAVWGGLTNSCEKKKSEGQKTVGSAASDLKKRNEASKPPKGPSGEGYAKTKKCKKGKMAVWGGLTNS